MKGHSVVNSSILRRMAPSLPKNYHDLRVGVNDKRQAAARDDSYLERMLLNA